MSQCSAWNRSTHYPATLSNEPVHCMKQIHTLPRYTKQWASGVHETDPQITSLHCSVQQAECVKQIHTLPRYTKQWASGVYYTDPQITSLHCSMKQLSACNKSTRYLATQNNETVELMQKTYSVPRHTKQRNDWVHNQAVCSEEASELMHSYPHTPWQLFKDGSQYKFSNIEG
jgi:hypothetical protein